MSQLSLFRGTTSEVNSRSLTDGQLLVDTQAGLVKFDSYVNGILTRQVISGYATQGDWSVTDSTSPAYILNKITKTSQLEDNLLRYVTTEPTIDLVDDKTVWIGGDGKVTLTFVNMDSSTYMTVRKVPGTTFPTIPDPTAQGYTFDHWNPTLPANVPSTDTTYTAAAES